MNILSKLFTHDKPEQPWTLHHIRKQVTSLLDRWSEFDTIEEIDEELLRKIVNYQIKNANQKPFFVIGANSIKKKEWFDIWKIDEMTQGNWYMLVNPNWTTHLIIVKDEGWIRFDKEKRILVNECKNWNAWGYGGWTFQWDKFNSKNQVIYSSIPISTLIGILAETLTPIQTTSF
jgi:hypothetical protein